MCLSCAHTRGGIMLKGRRHLHLELDILDDMSNSGIDVSEWASDRWIEDKYSVEVVKTRIKETEDKLEKLKEILKVNLKFQKSLGIITDPKERTLLERLSVKIKPFEGNLEKEEEILLLWKKQYKSYFDLNLSKTMVRKKLETYKKNEGKK